MPTDARCPLAVTLIVKWLLQRCSSRHICNSWLQIVLNTASWLVVGAGKCEYITPGRVKQLTGQRAGHWDGQTGQLLDNFHPYPAEQNGSDCQQAIHYVVYPLLAIAAILFYCLRMTVVQQLTCLTLGCRNGPAYSTDELLNTPQFSTSSTHCQNASRYF